MIPAAIPPVDQSAPLAMVDNRFGWTLANFLTYRLDGRQISWKSCLIGQSSTTTLPKRGPLPTKVFSCLFIPNKRPIDCNRLVDTTVVSINYLSSKLGRRAGRPAIRPSWIDSISKELPNLGCWLAYGRPVPIRDTPKCIRYSNFPLKESQRRSADRKESSFGHRHFCKFSNRSLVECIR